MKTRVRGRPRSLLGLAAPWSTQLFDEVFDKVSDKGREAKGPGSRDGVERGGTRSLPADGLNYAGMSGSSGAFRSFTDSCSVMSGVAVFYGKRMMDPLISQLGIMKNKAGAGPGKIGL
jgi:hypothetical protein